MGAPAGPLRYVMSLAEQSFISALNLGTNLWLIRHLRPAEYGVFVLATNAALILCNVQGGVTNAHLLTLPPGPPGLPGRASAERMIMSMTLLMVGASFLVGAVVVTIVNRDGAVIPATIALYVPAFMLYSYTRALAFSRGLVMTGTVQSAGVLLAAILLLGVSSAAGVPAGTGAALLILAAAYGGAALVTMRRLCGGMVRHLRWQDLLHARAYARDSAWVLIGIGSIELLGRFNSVIVSVWFDTAAVGTLGATQLLLRPIGIVVSACSQIGRLGMVQRRDAGDWGGFTRTVLWSAAGSLAISVPWVGVVYLAWPLISARLFAGLYAGDSGIVLLSGLSTIIGVALFVLSLGFQTLRRFRLLACADMAGAVVAIGVTLALVTLHFGLAMSLVGMMTGQLLDLVLLGLMLARVPSRARALATVF